MKHLCLILIVLNVYYGSVSLESQDKGLRQGKRLKGVGKKLPEKQKSFHKHLKVQSGTEEYANVDTSNQSSKRDTQKGNVKLKNTNVKPLFGHEYFRVDSRETTIEAVDRKFEKSYLKGIDKEDLYSKDYYRIDSDESVEKLKGPIRGNFANREDSQETKRYKDEIAAGDITELFGTNPHNYQPEGYHDLGRRFVLSYPYAEIEKNKNSVDAEDSKLEPVMAPPELVLAVAKQSALLNAAKPVNPTEYLVDKNILRTGEYWNSYWKEDVDPEKLSLRTSNQNKMGSIKTKLSPGTDIYKYVSQLKQENPKLLYIINNKNI